MNHVRIENLLPFDKNGGRDEKIKEAVKVAVYQALGRDFTDNFSLDKISFNLPEDHSVNSEHPIRDPIVIEASFIVENASSEQYRNDLRNVLKRKIWCRVSETIQKWRKVKAIKVHVTFMDLDPDEGGWLIK